LNTLTNTDEITCRDDCTYMMDVPTRWNDNDQLGHVNNVMYYSYFEAVVVRFLMQEGGLDWMTDQTVPLAVETLCKFRRSLSYPDMVEAGLRITKMGNSSVTYSVGLFTEGNDAPAALGHFVHVYVDRDTDSSVPIPDHFRALYKRYS
jgi:acyl-CoA thioester hydrolase